MTLIKATHNETNKRTQALSKLPLILVHKNQYCPNGYDESI